MKNFPVHIMGDGSFGTFLKTQLPNYGFDVLGLTFPLLTPTVILAVPLSAYDECARTISVYQPDVHLVNVCSVQQPSTEILLKWTPNVLSVHPLFGTRTPADKRNSIWTFGIETEQSNEFLLHWCNFSVTKDFRGTHGDGPKQHDMLMARTHAAAVLAAKQAKVWVDAAADVPDELIPNSFRLLRQFVKTLDDMPAGTISSIMANPYL